MIMMNCSQCGLTVTASQDECPKCHKKIKDIIEEQGLKRDASVTEVSEEVTSEVGHVEASSELTAGNEIESEANIDDLTSDEEIATEDENTCENCMSVISEDQNFCQLCGEAASAIEMHVNPITPQTDAEANKWIAVVGYVFFFLPLLLGYYKKSKFAKFHTRQAFVLFVCTIVLFLGLLLLRNTIDSLWAPASATGDLLGDIMSGLPGMDVVASSQRGFFNAHGVGAFLRFYLIVMINVLHLIPFAFMIIGMINAAQGKKRQLPIIRRFANFD